MDQKAPRLGSNDDNHDGKNRTDHLDDKVVDKKNVRPETVRNGARGDESPQPSSSLTSRQFEPSPTALPIITQPSSRNLATSSTATYLKERSALARILFLNNDVPQWQFTHPRLHEYTPHVVHREVDPQWVRHLQPDIASRWYSTEVFTAPRFDLQVDILPRHRALLINWLVQLQGEWGLRDESLHLSVKLLDRVLSTVQFPRSRLQLLGCTAMFLASKFEEVSAPKLSAYVYISINAFDPQELIRMERTVLELCQYGICTPYSIDFANYYLNSLFLETSTILYVYYVLDRLLLEPEILQHFSPSQQAVAAIIYSLHFFQHFEVLDAFIAQQTVAYPHTTASLAQCVHFIWNLLTGFGSSDNEVHRKYANLSYCEVSLTQYPNFPHPDNVRYVQYRLANPHQALPQAVPQFELLPEQQFRQLLEMHRQFEVEQHAALGRESTVISINGLCYHLLRLPSNLSADYARNLSLYYTPPPPIPLHHCPLLLDFQTAVGAATPESYAFAQQVQQRQSTSAAHYHSKLNPQQYQQLIRQQQQQQQEEDNDCIRSALDMVQLGRLTRHAEPPPQPIPPTTNPTGNQTVQQLRHHHQQQLERQHALQRSGQQPQQHQPHILPPQPAQPSHSTQTILQRTLPIQVHQRQQQIRNNFTHSADADQLPHKPTANNNHHNDDEQKGSVRRPNLRKK